MIVRLATCIALGSLAVGCLDTEGRYQDYIDRTDDLRAGGDDAGPGSSERIDFSGDYLLALSTVIAPDAPILFATRADVAEDLGSLTLELQALSTDTSSPPRVPVGDPITVVDVPYRDDGTFEADLGVVQVPGAANSITGSDITAEVSIVGLAGSDTDEALYFCGDVLGMVTSPLALDLAGSTFGAAETATVVDAAPLLGCPTRP